MQITSKDILFGVIVLVIYALVMAAAKSVFHFDYGPGFKWGAVSLVSLYAGYLAAKKFAQ